MSAMGLSLLITDSHGGTTLASSCFLRCGGEHHHLCVWVCWLSLLLFLKWQSSPQKGVRSHGTTAALQAFPFCDSHGRCFRVRERPCVYVTLEKDPSSTAV